MKNIRRSLIPPQKQSFFLFGPRGVGKTRLLKQEFTDSIMINLLEDRFYLQLIADTQRLESMIVGHGKKRVVIIDEVQKIPQLLSVVHNLIEQDKYSKIQFILTGSSSRKLKLQGVDLLAGRAIIKNLYPFTAEELGPQFSLSKALQHGTIPLIWNSIEPDETLSAYIKLYLKEEVKQEGLVRNIESFSRFLEVMCFCHAEIINLSNVSRESQIKRSTLDGYLSILEDLLLGYRIQSFKVKNRKQTVESEKFYFFDTGIFSYLTPKGILIESDQFKGQALEGLVAQMIRATLDYRRKKENLFFWRTQSGNEVDFVIYGPSTFIAIEVKSSTSIKIEYLRSLKSFAEDYPEAKKYCLYRGKDELQINDILCINVKAFLLNLNSYLNGVS